MSYVFRTGCALLVLSLCALTAFAQDSQTTAPDSDDVTVVVTAERLLLPVSESIATTSVVTAKQLRESGAQTVADALRLVPGVTIRQSGAPGALVSTFVRGSSCNQVLVLVDGQRISSPAFYSGTDLSKFPVDNIARIEIIRGPASSLYGSDAFGGVVNIITKTPTNGFTAVIGSGNNGREERALTVQGPAGKANWQISASFPSYDGSRPNSDFAATSLSGKVVIPDVKGWTATLTGENYHDKLGLPNADPYHTGYYDPDDRQWWDRGRFDLSLTRALSFGDVQVHTYQNTQRLHNTTITEDPQFPSYSDSRITGETLGMETVFSGHYGKHAWAAGAEYRDDEYTDAESGTYADPSQPSQQEGITNRAIFAQDRWDVGQNTDLVLGARLDDHSTAGSKATPRIGINHRVGSVVSLRASYAEGFRAPNFVELYYPVGPWGPGYSGNPNLKPESSRQYEVGANAHLNNDDMDIALFTSNVRDLISATSATPYENIGHACQRGIEMNWQHRFTGDTRLDFSYTYAEAINRDTDTRLLARPRNKASLTATTGIKNWEVGLTGRWVDKRPDLIFDPVTYVSQQITLPGFTVFDLSLTRKTNLPVEPYFTFRNLFNHQYDEVAGYPAEGFSLESGVRLKW